MAQTLFAGILALLRIYVDIVNPCLNPRLKKPYFSLIHFVTRHSLKIQPSLRIKLTCSRTFMQSCAVYRLHLVIIRKTNALNRNCPINVDLYANFEAQRVVWLLRRRDERLYSIKAFGQPIFGNTTSSHSEG